MKKLNMIVPIILLLTIAGSVLYVPMSTAAGNISNGNVDDYGYGYCSVSIGSSTDLKQVISSVYKVKTGTIAVGVQNSFRDYVDAEFDGGARSTPICYTTIDTYQEAADNRNEWIGRLRRSNWTVYTVNWSYRGD